MTSSRVSLICSAVCCAWILTSGVHVASAAVLRVDIDVSGGAGDGSTWADAYGALQDALVAATDGDELWIAEGIYFPDVGVGLTDDDRALSYVMKTGVSLYGGFNGSEAQLTDRDPDAHSTILSGDIDQNDTTTNGVVNTHSHLSGDNSRHVIQCTNQSRVLLDGLIVTGGLAGDIVGSGMAESGAGMLSDACEFTLRNVWFAGNKANTGGSGASQGGGLHARGTQAAREILLIDSCRFSGNLASIAGGGISVENHILTLNDSVIEDNVLLAPDSTFCLAGVSQGGGMNITDSEIVLERNLFSGNKSSCDGGGLSLWLVDGEIRESSFVSNRVEPDDPSFAGSGGGLLVHRAPSLRVESSLFAGNYAANDGGGIMRRGAQPLDEYVNITVVGNQAGGFGGGIYNIKDSTGGTSVLAIKNSVVYANAARTGPDSYPGTDGPIEFYNTLLANSGGSGLGWDASLGDDKGGNLGGVPTFRGYDPFNPGSSDFRVAISSVTVDAGDSVAVQGAFDLLGAPRIHGVSVDMGAYETQLSCPVPGTPRLYVDDGAGGGTGSGLDWANALTRLQDAFYLAEHCSYAGVKEIWVADGIYTPDQGEFHNPGDHNESFLLQSGLEVLGGFDGTESSRDARDPALNPTILSGDLLGDDTNTGGVVLAASDQVGDNTLHVVRCNGTDATAVLDGFTITAGHAAGIATTGENRGAGIRCIGGSPTLRGLFVVGNQGSLGGGVALSSGSDAHLINSFVQGNEADDSGGGIYIENSDPLLENVLVSGNLATLGGGISVVGSAPQIINGTIAANDAQSVGGGLFIRGGSQPHLTNSIVFDNRDGNSTGGGASNVRVSDGISVPTFSHCLVQDSGGSSSWDTSLGADSGGNVDGDPDFVSATTAASAPVSGGDFTLGSSSVSIDMGDNLSSNEALDLGGDPRITDGDGDGVADIDMGAFEAPGGTGHLDTDSVDTDMDTETDSSVAGETDTACESLASEESLYGSGCTCNTITGRTGQFSLFGFLWELWV